MKPFIPAYIPSIGEVDAFLKINRPDNLPEEMGLSVIDEPTINGIDPYIFSLELTDILKTKVERINVKSIENAEKNPKAIDTWIEQMTDLHKKKMSSDMNYTKKMPDIESLMQVWPDGLDQALKDHTFPDESLNISVENYAKIICNLLDIPIHKLEANRSLIEALHVLFTLYSEVKENQSFPRKENKGNVNNDVQSMKFY